VSAKLNQLLYVQITNKCNFLVVYYCTPQLLHVSTHAFHHQGAYLCLLSYIKTRANLWYPLVVVKGPDSSVGVATDYGLDGPGIEFRWGRDFSNLS
jgi:hypothetical protein